MNTRTKALAILNPATGQVSVENLTKRLRETATRRGVELDVRVTDGPEHATELARECLGSDIDIVIAVGGDGTIAEVVTGTIGDHITVGIVPNGSTNIFAKDLGIPRRLQSAMDVALGQGTPTAFDVGRVGNSTFMHMVGAGYDAQIFLNASGKWKRRIGWLAYLWPATKHLRSDPFHLEMEIDGHNHSMEARMVLCAIGGSIVHPRFTVGRGIDRHDGLFDICVYNPPNAVAAVSALLWILLRRPERSRWQRQFLGKKVVLRSDPSIVFEADGTPLGMLPVVVEMLDTPVHILTPTKNR
jgi:diacylglycerol kinase (ATP)